MLGRFASGAAVSVLIFCFLQVHFIFINLISAYDDDDFSEPANSFDAPSVSGMFKNTENTCSGPDCLESIQEFPVCSESEFLDEKLGICLNKVNLEVCDGEGCVDEKELEIRSEVEFESVSEVEPIVESEIGTEGESEIEAETEPEVIQQSEPEITSEFWPEIDVETAPESDTVPETEPLVELEIDANGEAEISPELVSETVQTTEKQSESVAKPIEEEIFTEELTTEEIQRLAAAFVFCIIGTLASRGNLIWTAVLYAYLFAMFYWWAYDKHDDIIDSFVKVKTSNEERNAEKQRQRSGGYYYKTEPPAQPHN